MSSEINQEAKMKVGDFIKGKPESDRRYRTINSSMTRGVILWVGDNAITVKILEHSNDEWGEYTVDPQYFEVIGHVKPFNRDEVLELLKNGCKEAILDYDLRDVKLGSVDLSQADLSELDLRYVVIAKT